MPLNDCPSRLELDSFQAGNLGDAELASLESHIEGCSTCQKSLETVIGESADRVLVALLEAAEPDTFASEASCRTAVQRVTALARELSAGGGTEATIASAQADAKGAASGQLPVESIREYKLLAKLGEGGMGAVYKALHTRLDKVVALKVLPAERMRDTGAVARFQREMKAVGKLDHPNIVRAMDAGEEAGMHFLVMEYVEGLDLSQLAKNTGPLPIADACELVRQAALGLAEAHEHGMVHRDIKPSNLILAKPKKKKGEPTVKILDLGLALLSEALAPDAGGLTTSGQMMGTIDYMAPEQGGDSHQVDIRADIYSLGATLYRLLTGSAPFAGEKFDTPVKKLMALATQSPTSARSLRPDVPAPLAAVIDKMLAKSPAARYATPEELAEALGPFCKNANLAALLSRGTSAVGNAVPGVPNPGQDVPASEIGTQNHLSSPSGDTAPTIDRGASPLPLPLGEGRGEGAAVAVQVAPKAKPRPLVAAVGGRKIPRSFTIAAACGGLALAVLLGITFYIQTQQGTIQVEINDPAIKVVLDNDGNTVFQGVDKKHEITLKPGPHGMTITRGDFSFDTTQFELKRKEVVVLSIKYLPGKIQITDATGKVRDERPLPAYALQFDGVDDYVDLPTLKFDPAEAFTMELWAEVGNPTESPQLLHYSGVPGRRAKIQVGVPLGPDKPNLMSSVTVGPPQEPAQNPEYATQRFDETFTGGMQHIALCWSPDGSTSLYWNGRRCPNPIVPDRTKSWPTGTSSMIGANPKAVGTKHQFLKGSVRHVRFSRGVRYADQFSPDADWKPDANTLALYRFDEGAGDVLYDTSGNNHHGKIVGAKWVARVESAPKAFLVFDDRTDAVDLSAVPYDGSHDLTVEGWFRTLELGHCEFARFEPEGPVLFAMPKGNQGEISAQWKGADGKEVYAVCPGALRAGELQHIALVYRRQKMLVFVDGKPIAESPVVARPGSVQRLKLSNALMELHGLRISRVSRYSVPFEPERQWPRDDKTIALYRCNEGAGDVLTDSSGNNHHGKIVGAKWVETEPTSAAVTVQQRTEGGYEVTAPGYRLKIAATGLVESVESGTTKLLESTAFGSMGTVATRKTTVAQAGTTLTFTEGDDYRLIYEFGPQGFAVKTRVSMAAAERDGLDGKSYYLFHQTRFPKSAQRVRPLDGESGFNLPATRADQYTNHFVVDFMDGWQVELKSNHPSEHSGFLWTEGPYTWGRTNPKSDADNEIRYDIRPPGQAQGWHGWPADAPLPAIAPFDAAQAKAHQEAWAKYLGVPVEYENSIGMKFRLIPPGEFMQGSTPAEVDEVLQRTGGDKHWEECARSEGPRHKVILTQPMYLGATEVTQEEFEKVMGKNPSFFAKTGAQANHAEAVAGRDVSRHPVEGVTWHDAAEFCSKLSQLEKLVEAASRSGAPAIAGKAGGYRLPSEGLWEFACRGGTTTHLWCGNIETDLPTAGWFAPNSNNRTHAVGELQPNPFGLRDVYGNVWEWMRDSWDASAYAAFANQPAVDPTGPSQGENRVVRGGYWSSLGPVCRSAYRDYAVGTTPLPYIGFRASLSVEAVRQSAKSTTAGWHGWPADAPRPAIAPFNAEEAKIFQAEWAKYLGVPVEKEVELPGDAKMTFVLIPPGEFVMGSTAEEQTKFLQEAQASGNKNAFEYKWTTDHISSEGPQHRVRITKPFYLGKYEVTQAQWQAVMGSNPSHFKHSPTHPVESLTWDDIQPFLGKLNEKQSAGQTIFSLPTQAQWEYACRAGTTTYWHHGDRDEDLRRYGWFDSNSGETTHAVGALGANSFGLHDMHGNVWECCADFYAADYYAKSPLDDPDGDTKGPRRVVCGGAWQEPAAFCRSAMRTSSLPNLSFDDGGFRVALSVEALRELTSSGGFALEFNGKDSYVDLPTLKYDGSHPITLEATVRMHQSQKFGAVLADFDYSSAGDNSGMALYSPVGDGGIKESYGMFSVAVSGEEGRWANAFTLDVLKPNVVVQVAAVMDGSAIRLFLDGKRQKTVQLQGNYKVSPNSFLIGGRLQRKKTGTSTGIVEAFSGVIDEIRISKVARYDTDYTPELRLEADAETLALYHFDEGQGEALTDSSGNNHHGKIVGAKWVKADGPAATSTKSVDPPEKQEP